jgi:transcriptional regulator with XRE-family HTH domain
LEAAVRLAEWRKSQNWTQQRLADALRVTQPLISTFERARNPAIPGPALMTEIYVLTGGAVRPDDFYELPALAGEPVGEAA